MDKFDELREKVVPALMPYGLKRAAVFGSFARGEDTPDSDIDILVDFEEPQKQPMGLLTWVRLERELSESIGKKVDLVPNSGLKKHLRPHVEKDMVMLYEKKG